MKRIFYIDFLRIISMLGVILLHASATKLRMPIDFSWHLVNFLTSFATCSVPIFFMISGSLLLNSDSTANINILWKKRLPKLLIPFFIWSIINIIGYSFILKINNLKLLLISILQIPGRPGEISLWFMYPFIIIYVFSPVLLLITQNKSLLKYVLFIWLIFVIILPTFNNILPFPLKLIFSTSQDWKIIGGYAGYFLLGYYLSKIDTQKISYKRLLIVFLSIIFVIALGTYFFTLKNRGAYDESFKLYTSLFVCILASTFFLLCQKAQEKYPIKLIKIFEFIVPSCYGVYLIHNLLILFFNRNIPYFIENKGTKLSNFLCK